MQRYLLRILGTAEDANILLSKGGGSKERDLIRSHHKTLVLIVAVELDEVNRVLVLHTWTMQQTLSKEYTSIHDRGRYTVIVDV